MNKFEKFASNELFTCALEVLKRLKKDGLDFGKPYKKNNFEYLSDKMIELNGDRYGISFLIECFDDICTLAYDIVHYVGKLSPLDGGFVDFGKEGMNSKTYNAIENDIIYILSKLNN